MSEIGYKVSEVFDTISGEAPTAGERCSFVRLHGCPVRCRTCDTLYSVFEETLGFKLGYLKGLTAGDGHITAQPSLQIGMKDLEALERAAQYWGEVFSVAPLKVNVRTRPDSAYNPGASYFRVNGSGQERVRTIAAQPRTPEERRGFVGGFYDAEGSCVKPSGRNTKFGLEFTNSEPMNELKKGLVDWSFRFTESAGFNRSMGRELRTIRLVAFPRSDLSDSLRPLERKMRWEQEGQRFFDCFRPAIRRKYGPWLLRWTPSDDSSEQIASRCKEELVVISGGDPMIWNLDPLLKALRDTRHRTQVETSGAYPFKGRERPDILVCSPKPNVRYFIAPSVLETATIFKLVDGPENSGFTWNAELAASLKRGGKRVFMMPYGQPPSEFSARKTQERAKSLGYEFSPRLQYVLGVR